MAQVLLLLPFALGHAAIWIALVNWLHATATPRPLMKGMTAVMYGWLLAGVPVYLALLIARGEADNRLLADWSSLPAGLFGYAILTWTVAAIPLPLWLWSRMTVKTPAALLNNHTTCHNWQSDYAHLGRRCLKRNLLRLPINESLCLDANEKSLRLERLPPALDGLAIVHLSDFHFTGIVDKGYFQAAVRTAMKMDADLIALTGDFIDKRDCLDWLQEILSPLSAPHGVYFVLGNHDLRVDVPEVRRRIIASGATYLGGQHQTLTIRGCSVLLAGNEVPWIKPAADLSALPPESGPERALRVLLSHSPDQLNWARRHDFDLVLAGHNHGGQIALPLLGPIVSPSLHGVRYAGGTYYQSPTLMHVSRGISAQLPLRIGSRPEVTRLVLRSAE